MNSISFSYTLSKFFLCSIFEWIQEKECSRTKLMEYEDKLMKAKDAESKAIQITRKATCFLMFP